MTPPLGKTRAVVVFSLKSSRLPESSVRAPVARTAVSWATGVPLNGARAPEADVPLSELEFAAETKTLAPRAPGGVGGAASSGAAAETVHTTAQTGLASQRETREAIVQTYRVAWGERGRAIALDGAARARGGGWFDTLEMRR